MDLVLRLSFSLKRFWTLKSWLDGSPLLLYEVFSLWFTRLTRCFVTARVSPECTGSGYRLLRRDEMEESRCMILLFRCVLYEDRLLSLSRCVLWYCKYFKAFNKDYFCIIFCSAVMWDSVWCFFFFFYSIFLPYLFSPSNFFLLMIWNVRCLNGQHGSLMLIFGVENPSSLQYESKTG